jgi:hypothetical protein
MSEETNQPEREFTKEELLEIKNKTVAFYEEQIPFLKKQTEYEELKARIDKARFESFEARVKHIQLEHSVREVKETEE